MKRDMELIRNILFDIEERPDASPIESVKIEGHSEEEIDFHICLMIEAELLKGILHHPAGRNLPNYFISYISWEGYEFLGASRNESVWKSTIEKCKGLPFETIKFALLEGLKTSLSFS